MNYFRLVQCAIASITLTSCATVARGTTEDIVINYLPMDAEVTTSLNHQCTSSPCIIKVPRKESFGITVARAGYLAQTVHVGTKVSRKGAASLAGNALSGGLIGIGVDVATGAGRDHYPNPVNVDLVSYGSGTSIEFRLSPVTNSKIPDYPSG